MPSYFLQDSQNAPLERQIGSFISWKSLTLEPAIFKLDPTFQTPFNVEFSLQLAGKNAPNVLYLGRMGMR